MSEFTTVSFVIWIAVSFYKGYFKQFVPLEYICALLVATAVSHMREKHVFNGILAQKPHFCRQARDISKPAPRHGSNLQFFLNPARLFYIQSLEASCLPSIKFLARTFSRKR